MHGIHVINSRRLEEWGPSAVFLPWPTESSTFQTWIFPFGNSSSNLNHSKMPKTFWSIQPDLYFKNRPTTNKSRGFPVFWISQELSISDVQFESIKAFSEVATAVVVTVPRGAMGYTLALCLAHLLTKGCHWDFQRLKSYHCNQAIWRVGGVGYHGHLLPVFLLPRPFDVSGETLQLGVW